MVFTTELVATTRRYTITMTVTIDGQFEDSIYTTFVFKKIFVIV